MVATNHPAGFTPALPAHHNAMPPNAGIQAWELALEHDFQRRRPKLFARAAEDRASALGMVAPLMEEGADCRLQEAVELYWTAYRISKKLNVLNRLARVEQMLGLWAARLRSAGTGACADWQPPAVVTSETHKSAVCRGTWQRTARRDTRS